jgi:hypothetical protein
VPFLPKCFEDDDDDEEKPHDTATQASAIGSRPSPRDLSSWPSRANAGKFTVSFPGGSSLP